jgi:GxxExxY protein
MKYSDKEYPLQQESYQIIGICMEVHRILGKGLLEIVYKDAIEYELRNKEIPYERERNTMWNTRESFCRIIFMQILYCLTK